jgi:nitronate monooxygenase
MPLPPLLEGRLRLPVVAAPMFLVSGPALVVAASKAGVLGTFPALNQRSSEGFDDWLSEIEDGLAGDPKAAPYGVNLIVHRSNPRVEADLALCVKHKVPVVITSLGAVADLVDTVHAYGGVVFHDVINRRHAEKAAEAGVDGLILVSAGAGGHAGTYNPFAFLPEIRRFFKKTILLAGSISDGRGVAAARMLGADLAYLGTRFIATRESLAADGFKEMILAGKAADIVYTPAISGIHGNFLKESIRAVGLDPDNLPANGAGYKAKVNEEQKAWKHVWSAGQGVGSIDDVPTAATLVDRLEREYREALAEMR